MTKKKNLMYKLLFLTISTVLLLATKTQLQASDLGTKENPYEISNTEELIAIKNNLSASYKLTKDIDLENKEWIPIGTIPDPFKGNFDGNGYIIKNMHTDTNKVPNVGFFGCAKNSKLENITIENIYMNGDYSVGSLVGRLEDSTISNTKIIGTGSVNGRGEIGTIIGIGINVKIEKCFVDYDISLNAGNNAGGIAGLIFGDKGSSIKNSYTKNKITLESGYAGNLIGNASYTTVSNCYSTGQIIGRTYGGPKGLIAFNGDYTVVSNSYSDGTVSGVTKSEHSRTTEQLQTKKTYEFWDLNNIWQMEDGQYPTLRYTPDDKEIIPTEMSGEGTDDNPYIIKDVIHLSNIKNNLLASYKLENDIDLKNNLWEPIGSATAPFKGKLDGNGYTIKNLYIAKKVTSNVGFFGYIDSADIKNLTIENVYVLGDYNMGAVSGYSKNSTLTNIHIIGNGKVEGWATAGGLLGYIENTNIDKCSSMANVVAVASVGGLVGQSSGAKISSISNSYAKGNLTGDYRTGGLLGVSQNMNIKNSFFQGEITSEEYTGGLVGQRIGYVVSTSSYFDSSITKITTPVSEARTTEQLKLVETFIDWDFINVWQIKEGLFVPNFKTKDEPTEISITGSVSYKYDKTGRLIEANYESGQSLIYSYDLAGNIVSVEVLER